MVQYLGQLDQSFAAVSDPTRRGILDRLAADEASISVLAEVFGMTLTGIRKHVAVLEEAGLVTTAKVGRVRTCTITPCRLDREVEWLRQYQEKVEARYAKLDQVLDELKLET